MGNGIKAESLKLKVQSKNEGYGLLVIGNRLKAEG
jgi:hypothetical protein